jgi:hypothetical protein
LLRNRPLVQGKRSSNIIILECDSIDLLTYLLTYVLGVAVPFIQHKASDNLLVAPRIGLDRLNLVLDSENGGVPKHLGEIAEQMYEWEGKVSDELGLTKPDVNNIKELHKNQLKLQA